jgi:23S rRNA pseudouridine2605 synthase
VVLNEGRYREIGRLFKALGHPVIRLHREKVEFLNDRGLASGAFRSLHPDEVSRLLEISKVRPSPARRRPRSRQPLRGREVDA